MARPRFEHRVTLGTDVASFLLYHPDDFPGRPGRPMECLCHDFAWAKEVGKVIAFSTGGDGVYTFRLTDGPLTRREQRWRTCSAELLYTARHGEIVLDNGSGSSLSFDLPNGHYRVTLHAINWSEEPGVEGMPAAEQLPSYVIRFEPVKDPAEVNPVPWPPRLDLGPEPEPACSISGDEGVELADEEPLADEYILLVEKDVLVLPGAIATIEISDRFYERVMREAQVDRFIVAPSARVPTVAAITDTAGGGKSGDGPWSYSFRGKHLVTVTGTRQKGKDVVARYRLLERPRSRPKPEAVAALKAAFVRYARSNPRGLRIENLDFTLEEWEADPSAQRYAWWLLSTLPLHRDERDRLALVSLAEQVRALHAWLTSPERAGDAKTVRSVGDRDREFLQAIIANPDDDAPRLVYADWLEEQGDPRAEFIRLDCELATLKDDTPRHKTLTRRKRELLDEYEKDWQGPFGKLGLECQFRRGFITSAEMTAKQFLQHGEKLMAQGPLTTLQVKSFDRRTRAEQFQLLAACPLLARLRELHLAMNEITDAEAAVLAGSPHLANLKTLWLFGNNVGPEGVKALARSPYLAGLTSLGLPQNPVYTAGAVALAASKTLRNLEDLDLRYAWIGDRGLEALAGSGVVDGVKWLCLTANNTSNEGGGPITDRGVAALAASPHFGRLESLILDGNPVGDAGAIALAKSSHLKRLSYLSLDGCGITHVGAEAIAGSGRLGSLVRLSLGGNDNQIDDRAAAALAKSPRLEQLNLFMNRSLTAAGKKLLRKRFGKQPMSGYED